MSFYGLLNMNKMKNIIDSLFMVMIVDIWHLFRPWIRRKVPQWRKYGSRNKPEAWLMYSIFLIVSSFIDRKNSEFNNIFNLYIAFE